MNAPLCMGATVVVLPRFDLETFLAAIQNHRITGLYVAPPIVQALAKHPLVTEYDLSSLNHVISAAAPGLTKSEVMMHVAEHVAPYKRVRQVTFLDAVPRAASGKILRRALRTRSGEPS